MKSFLRALLSFIRVRPVPGGLEISDQVLRLVYFSGKEWKLAAVRLAPGVMEKGKINDAPALIAALRELRQKVPFSRNPKRKMNIVVSLSSVKMYTQVFTLPVLEGQNLADAVELNMKMISPIDAAQAYFGWEVIGKDEEKYKYEIAAAFADKALVDAMTETLYQAGFITVGIESRALAFARIFREKAAAADVGKAYLVIDVDNSGIDFLVVRRGRLYFEYATEWGEMADEKGQVSVEKFKEMLSADLRQVTNFSSQHWPEPIAAILLSAAVLEEEAEAAIRAATALPVVRLTLEMGQPISSEWLVALGSSLRGTDGKLKDEEINLSGPGAVDMFHDEQLLNFMALWRVLVPASLAVIIIALVVADNFLHATNATIEAQTVSVNQTESAEIHGLEASSTVFNQDIALVANAESKISGNYKMIPYLEDLAQQNGVTVDHISFQDPHSPISFAGTAPAEGPIVAFKNAVQTDPHFGTVNLPLQDITQNGPGYAFSMTFPLGVPFK